jgi:hypothetical protein
MSPIEVLDLEVSPNVTIEEVDPRKIVEAAQALLIEDEGTVGIPSMLEVWLQLRTSVGKKSIRRVEGIEHVKEISEG